ncbi:T9SS type A sorting domain-containing protein [Labilibacter sediminis]|nr:T9SS type A sorting domain-containing protein [Labilibacter sediminis]
MKKIYASLIFILICVTTWGQVSDPNFSPSSGSSDISINPVLQMTFDGYTTAIIEENGTNIIIAEVGNPTNNIQLAAGDGLFTPQDSRISFTGNAITFDLSSGESLDYSTNYAVYVYDNTIDVDAQYYNDLDNFTKWTFTTAAPAVPDPTFNPLSGSSSISINPVLQMTFDAATTAIIEQNNTYITIAEVGNPTNNIQLATGDGVFTPQDPRISYTGNTITLDLSSGESLDYNTNYAVYINDNTINVDASYYNELDNFTKWTFTTTIGSVPDPTFSPLSGSSNISVSPILQMTFDAATTAFIEENNTQITIAEIGNPTNNIQLATGDGMFTPQDSRISFTGNTITLNLSSGETLDYNTNYAVYIEDNTINVDAAYYGDLDNFTKWTFTTVTASVPDPTFSPLNGSSDISVSPILQMTFDAATTAIIEENNTQISIAEIGNPTNNIQLATGDGMFTPQDSRISFTGNTITLDLSSGETLDFNTNYAVYIVDNTINVDAAYYNDLDNYTKWTFTTVTASVSDPTFSPLNGSSDISISPILQMTFDDATTALITENETNITIAEVGNPTNNIQLATGDGLFIPQDPRISFTGNTITLDLSSGETLDYNTNYAVYVYDNTIDVDGVFYNDLDNFTKWTFTTEIAPPMWAATYPNLQNLSKTALDVYGQVDKDGDYYLVVTQSNVAPTEAQIKAGQDENGAAALISTTAAITADTEFISNLDINSLASETDYWVYIVAEDALNNFTTIEQLPFTTVQTSWAAAYPNIQNLSKTALDVYGQVDDNGTYYLVLTQSNVAPSEAQIKAGQDENGTAALVTANAAVTANTEFISNLDITSLDSETDYWVYIVVEDASNNFTSVEQLPFTTVQTSWAATYPNLQNLSKTALDIYGQVDDNGNYYLVLTQSNVAPSEAQIKAGQDENGAAALVTANAAVTANTEFISNLDITSLDSETDYWVYIVVEDASNNFTSVEQLPFTTVQTSWAATYPNLQNLSKTALDVYGQVDDNGNYYLVLTQSNVAPSEAQIKAGQDENGTAALISANAAVTANTEFISNLDITSLDSETNYWVYIVVEDASSNFTSVEQLPFTSQDTQTPSYNPTYPSINLITGTSATVEVQINEDGHYYWVVLLSTDAAPSIAQVINGTDASDNPVANSGNGALVADNTGQGVASGLTSETDYIAYIVSRDNNENYIETSLATTVPFTTADVTAPVATFDPLDLAINVDVNKTITISFNEAIYNTLGEIITNGNVSTIVQLNETYSGGPSVPASITYDEVNFIITIDPTSTLKELQLYNIRLDEIQDASSNSNSVINSTFTTNDITAPVTTFVDPIDGQLSYSVGSPLEISFDESVRNLDGSDISTLDLQTLISFSPAVTFTASINANADAITVYPNPYLEASTSYTFTVNQVEDVYGNEQLSAASINFTTASFNTWNGNAGDNDFTNSANWDPGYTAGASCIVPAGTPEVIIGSNSSFPNMVIEPLASVTINNGVDVTLTEELTLKSDATGTGSLINNGNLSVSSSNIKVEQNISNPTRYNFASSPVQNATMNNIGGDGLIYSWNNINGAWDAFGSDTDMSAGYGYILTSSQDLIFSGTLNSGNYTLDVKGTPKNAGWTLGGNPYTAAIDWEDIVPGDMFDIQDGFWIWLISDQYGSWNGSTGVGTNLEAGSLIPSNHAFWVRADWTSGETIDGTLTIRDTYLKHNTNSYLKSSGPTTNLPHIRLTGIHEDTRDEKVIAFNTNADESFELFDSEKRFGSNPNTIELYSTIEGKNLTINTYPEMVDNMVIPIGYKTKTSGMFTIRLDEALNFDNNLQVILKDLQQDVSIDLNTEGSYEFYSEAINTAARFEIELIGSIATNDNAPVNISSTKIYAVNKNIYINISDLKNPRYEIYDIRGRLMDGDKLFNNTKNQISINKTGIYIVKVISSDTTESKKVIIN